MMFAPGMQGGLNAQRPPPPYTGRFGFIVNTYNDPFLWGLVKSTVGFGIGVYVAREISAELASEALNTGVH